MKRKGIWQTLLLFVLAGIIYSCKKDETSSEEEFSPEVLEAKTWFESQVATGTLPMPMAGSETTIVLKPNWVRIFPDENANYKVLEVHLNGAEQSPFVTAECSEKYQQTKDKRYLASQIRLVIQTNKDTKAKDGFMMVAYPDLSYLEAHKDNPLNGVTYLKRPSDFSGLISYYNMKGEFVNGWKYIDGTAYTIAIIN